MTATVELIDASVDFGRHRALAQANLSVDGGEFVTLLGPSGSGKTTTLNAIAGFVPLSEGDVRLVGNSIAQLAPNRRGIGIVFQSYALFPHMSVGENVAFPLRAQKVGKRDRSRRVKEALELVQLEAFMDRKPTTLSGGQQQRVALARAIVFEPKVLLLDEPLAALDKQLRETMQVELKRLQRRVGITTIAVTHDQSEAMAMSDRVAVMRDGEIQQVATPDEAYSRPASQFVAKFLGEANLVPPDWTVVAEARRQNHARADGLALLRPEQIQLNRASDGETEARGVVSEAMFQGDRWKLTVESYELPDTPLIVSHSTNAERLSPGDAVTIRVIGDVNLVSPYPAESGYESHPPLRGRDSGPAATPSDIPPVSQTRDAS